MNNSVSPTDESKTKVKGKNGYWIELDDKDKIAVEKFADWFFEEFGYKAKVHKDYKREMWSIDATNKIIGRFFEKVIRFEIGEKASTVTIPKVIKRSRRELIRSFGSASPDI